MSRVFGGFTPRRPFLSWFKRNEEPIAAVGVAIGVALIVIAIIVSMSNQT